MKPQEIFNRASVHLMGMDGPSVDRDSDVCVYRGKDDDCEFNGQMCAVGLFIADEHYDDDLEGQGITGSQSVADAVAASWGQESLSNDQLSLLADLQDAHDHGTRAHDHSTRGRVWSNYIIESLDKVADKHHLRFDPKGASA
jgi:hypothetical protein